MLANASERRIMHNRTNSNDLQEIVTQALEEIKESQGKNFDINKVNLAEMARKTGLSRRKLRTLKKNGFIVRPNAHLGQKATTTVLTGYTDFLDDQLRKGNRNSSVLFERIREEGYSGSRTTVKRYIRDHLDLVPAKRQLVAPQGNRGRRYSTGPGECFQMDWGFVNVVTEDGAEYRVACFAMICHHCGQRFVEFFPNARQENLFIGMLHAFTYLGVPQFILTDNMKSIVTERDYEGHPIWHRDYEAFMKTVGFQTKLCRPRHPFTKGAVERLVRYVKDNFIAGRLFSNITELNIQALRWCNEKNSIYHQCVDCIPNEVHNRSCRQVAQALLIREELRFYLCPVRKISFDGFIDFEGRRFGVPFSYRKRICRVRRDMFTIYIYSDDLSAELVRHNVTWSRRASYCPDQYVPEQPEEFPSVPVKSKMLQLEVPGTPSGFEKFNFAKEVEFDV